MSLSPEESKALEACDLEKLDAAREERLRREAGLTSWNIVCLDPSTDWTGAVLMQYFEDGSAHLLEMTAISGDWDDLYSFKTAPRRTDLSGVVGRIYRTSVWLRRNLATWKNEGRYAFDVIAFEDVRQMVGVRRGGLTAEALIGATFAYLSLREIHDLPMYPIVRMSACAVTNTTAIFREPTSKMTEPQKKEKRARLKAAVQEFIVEKFGLTFHPSAYSPEEVEAICDAAAVGLAAGKKLVEELRAERAKAAQKTMRLGGSRGPAKKAKVAA